MKPIGSHSRNSERSPIYRAKLPGRPERHGRRNSRLQSLNTNATIGAKREDARLIRMTRLAPKVFYKRKRGVLMVEATTDLANPIWSSVSTAPLESGIQQSGDERQAAISKTADSDTEAKDTHLDLAGQTFPGPCGEDARLLVIPLPGE
jgi:hypothetical protein